MMFAFSLDGRWIIVGLSLGPRPFEVHGLCVGGLPQSIYFVQVQYQVVWQCDLGRYSF